MVWFGILVVSCSCVGLAWTYFPNNPMVRLSQEYVMKGMLGVIAVIISTILLKILWNLGRQEIRKKQFNCTQSPDWDYDTDTVGEVLEDGTYLQDQTPKLGTTPVGLPIGNQLGAEPVGCGQESPHTNGDKPDMKVSQTDQTKRKDTPFPVAHVQEYPVRRTFSGSSSDVWNEFLRYFENLAELNSWSPEKSRRVLLSTLRGQAETFAYGLPLIIQRDYGRLKQKMEERFGHTAMKERYIADAKLRKRQNGESLRDFGQAIEDLYRRAYPDNPDIVEENAIKAFLDKCGQSEDFRLAVKRSRPKSLQEAVVNAMQEECLRVGEKDLVKERPANKVVYEVVDGRSGLNMVTDAEELPRTSPDSRGNWNKRTYEGNYPQRTGHGPRMRPYGRGMGRGRGFPMRNSPDMKQEDPGSRQRMATPGSKEEMLN